MSTVSFRYPQKNTGEYATRALVVISTPSDKYFGVDISELDPEEQAKFTLAMEEVQNIAKDAIADLMIEFDLKHRYRYFFPEKMKDVIFD